MVDNIDKKEKWVFDKEVADCFDDMLERSIPLYETMRQSIIDILRESPARYRKNILELGCSNGIMLERIAKEIKYARLVGIDISEPMLENAKERLDGLGVELYNIDIETKFPVFMCTEILSILTIQFTPIECRQEIIQNIYNNLENGGVFIFIEKVLGSSSILEKLYTTIYYEKKKDNLYTEEQIKHKRAALSGVLVPLTSDWNRAMCKQAGFKHIDIFYRYMNFEGIIAIK